jgi:hypothetical protein
MNASVGATIPRSPCQRRNSTVAPNRSCSDSSIGTRRLSVADSTTVAPGQVKARVVGASPDLFSFGVENSPRGRSLAAGASFTQGAAAHLKHGLRSPEAQCKHESTEGRNWEMAGRVAQEWAALSCGSPGLRYRYAEHCFTAQDRNHSPCAQSGAHRNRCSQKSSRHVPLRNRGTQTAH